MTREELDSTTFNAEISASGSETLEVQTGRAEEVVVFVDDGTTGGSAASYSATIDAYHDEFGDYQRQATTGANTDFYHEFTANGSSVQVTVSDESAGAATRRILVKTYRSME